jgi:D-tyrosyl-tRNA(Tyr) deacylase
VKILLQRVAWARVTVDGAVVGSIDRGLLLLVGVERADDAPQARQAAARLATLRVFADAEGKMNLDVKQAGGAMLVVSQFTLAGSLRRGRRPSFDGAAEPATARALVEELARGLEEQGLSVARGVFGADMKVELCNDGPVTFLLDLPVAGGAGDGASDAGPLTPGDRTGHAPSRKGAAS